MNKILSEWFYVIKNCSVDNTYKIGWGKSIVECCLEAKVYSDFDEGYISDNLIKSITSRTFVSM